MSRKTRNNHDSFSKMNEVRVDYEDYGYEIQNSNRQKKHKEHKFKKREYDYDD